MASALLHYRTCDCLENSGYFQKTLQYSCGMRDCAEASIEMRRTAFQRCEQSRGVYLNGEL
ncbi:unnamed protein product [Haemonchus placei]|uniref:CX9C domain-containing protein n=1 Tax=Haemonchus placei TaxID=6290 RepID=A0A0N4WN64_HAEPC|nr:unnamed protein product [Haemonchus placei]